MKVLAVDGNSILNRSYYGVRNLSNSKGVPTNAVFGFFNVMDKMIKEVEPDCVAVAFDLSAPTFRHKQYDGYKAGRKGMPEELAVQLPITKELIQLFGYHIVECEGFEADDIMGTFARLCREQKAECVIATGDRDNLQLVGDGVTVRLATNKEAILFDTDKIVQEYGVTPPELIEVKALMGDSSDNIPGVKGIGEKTALSLVSKYHSVSYILDHAQELDATTRVKNLLSAEGARELAEMSRMLGTIVDNAPIDGDLSHYAVGPRDDAGLYRIFSELELKKFLERYHLQPGNEPAPAPEKQPKKHFTVLQNPSAEQIREQFGDSVDFLYSEGLLLLNLGDTIVEYNFDAESAFQALVLQNDRPKRTHGAKELYKRCFENGEQLTNLVFSTDLAAYLLDALAKGYALGGLIEKYLPDFRCDVEERYKEIAAFPALCDALSKELTEWEMGSLLHDIELPLSEVLANMENEGFQVDVAGVRTFGEMLQVEIERITQEIYGYAGEEFNINSTRELGAILFDKLGLPTGKKTKTGYSTNVDVLEKLIPKHPIAGLVLEYRKLTKLSSTYVTGLLKVTGPDQRVHSVFRQTETRTGRISSTEPNMQNIPIRTELGSQMRKFFVAKPGCVLLDADYSQIELRILAHISNDSRMITAFREGADIHTATASQVFGVPAEVLPAELRRRAKAINFGIVYGIGAYSLSQDINVSVAEAKEYIENYLHTYSGVRQYMNDIVESSAKSGYVKTMFGRVRHLPEITSSNHNTKAFGERVALNTPIQGTAADIIKIAMVKVYRRLKEEGLSAQLILQVHDELLIEVSKADAPRAKVILKEEMEHAADLSVPLSVDVSEGENWYDAKG
ncbi:MAG: DNA polymerase I [Massilioclostridium sp.]|nr:DNA polymerase I [Massilioclostridium sp.]MEE1490519.1 DNA polymerase I [Massilioclostridium sp.]